MSQMITSKTQTSARVQMILALGDALIFIFFAAVGRAAHDLPPGESTLLTWIEVAAPFALAWYIAALLLGVYRRTSLSPLHRWLMRALVVWIIACALGLVVRSALLQRPIVPAFALTTLGINAALLLGWRLLIGLIHIRRFI